MPAAASPLRDERRRLLEVPAEVDHGADDLVLVALFQDPDGNRLQLREGR